MILEKYDKIKLKPLCLCQLSMSCLLSKIFSIYIRHKLISDITCDTSAALILFSLLKFSHVLSIDRWRNLG